LEKNDEPKLIKWTGEAGIEEAAAAREELLDAFNNANEVQLDISSVDDIDVSAIQIIIASFLEADKNGKRFSIIGEIPDVIEKFCKSCGVSLSEFNSKKKKEVKNA
jgi:anti-anti-sigma regulatory factor